MKQAMPRCQKPLGEISRSSPWWCEPCGYALLDEPNWNTHQEWHHRERVRAEYADADAEIEGRRPIKRQIKKGASRTARQEMDRAASEDDLLATITDALTMYGYRWFHIRRSDKAVQMGHAGFPDICAVRRGKVWLIELKAERGELDAEQWAWMHAAGMIPEAVGGIVPNVLCRVWRPSDVDRALVELR